MVKQVMSNTKFTKLKKGTLIKSLDQLRLKEIFQESSIQMRSVQFARINESQMNAYRQPVAKCLKKTSKLRLCKTFNLPVTSRPAEIRMGKGKGSFSFLACKISPGKALFGAVHFSTVKKKSVFLAILNGLQKLPVRMKIFLILGQ